MLMTIQKQANKKNDYNLITFLTFNNFFSSKTHTVSGISI